MISGGLTKSECVLFRQQWFGVQILLHQPWVRKNTIMAYAYGYDKRDNISFKQTEHGTYLYDDKLYRLKTAGKPDTRDGTFPCDLAGNRISSPLSIRHPG